MADFDPKRFALENRLASLRGERRSVAAQRGLPEIDEEIAAVEGQLAGLEPAGRHLSDLIADEDLARKHAEED